MRATVIGWLLGAVLVAGPAFASDPYDPQNFAAKSQADYDAYSPRNCNGVDWDDKHPLVVAKVVARSRVNFLKSPYDDDFTAMSCPADTPECRRKACLVPSDLVLVGKSYGAYTCATYQSPLATKQVWARGWLPTASLKPVAPNRNPRTSDWLGTWSHPGGSIEIARGDGGKLHIEGEMVMPTANDFHNGGFEANAAPRGDTFAFADDSVYGDGCQVRMQRIGPWLLVEDNDGCGGAGVTFVGFYRRKN